MEFSNYANRIKSLVNFDTFEKPPAEYKKIFRFTVKQGEMVKTNVIKTKFSQLNDKRFYFPDGEPKKILWWRPVQSDNHLFNP